MSRQELDAAMMDYLFDELPPVEAARFEAAIAHHPELLDELKDHRRTLAVSAEIPDAVMPSGLLDGVVAAAQREVAIVEQQSSFWESILGWMAQPVALAAALLLLVGSISLFGDLETPSGGDHDIASLRTSPTPPEDPNLSGQPQLAAVAAEAPAPQDRENASESGVEVARTAAAADMEKKVRDLKVRELSPGLVSRLRKVDAPAPAAEVEGEQEVAQAPPASVKVPRARVKAKSRTKGISPKTEAEAQGAVRVASSRAKSSKATRGAKTARALKAPPTAARQISRPLVASGRPDREAPMAASRSAAQEVKASQSTDDARRAARLVRDFKRLVAKGKLGDARQVLKKLAAIPGQEAAVKRGRETLKASAKARAKSKPKAQKNKKKGKAPKPMKPVK